TPQFVHQMGGFKVQGKTEAQGERILADAKALEEAGAFSLVLEGVPSILAGRVTSSVHIPTIGIGAGPQTDGQVLVFHDFVGLTTSKAPKFVKRYANLADDIARAGAENDLVVVSIFVNPLQFGPGEDLARYPRPIEKDLEMLRGMDVDAVYMPGVEDMYPESASTRVMVGSVSELLEGASRPG